jgi:hypothetical protein
MVCFPYHDKRNVAPLNIRSVVPLVNRAIGEATR